MKTIGILGGLGPESTADFNQRLVSICQNKYKAVEDYEFPPIIIHEVPIKSFDEKGIENSIKVFNALKKGIKRLEESKVSFIVIDCNTVHCYIDRLRKLTKLPIISIIEEVLKEVKKKKYKLVGLLGSQTTIDKGVYDKVFSKAKIDIIHPKEKEKKIITSVIFRVMGGKNNKTDIAKLRKIIQNMRKRGAEAIIIGCTELSIPLRDQKFEIPILDSTEILANATIQYAMMNNRL